MAEQSNSKGESIPTMRFGTMNLTIAELVEIRRELQREEALRIRVYPKWVAEGKMTQEKSEKRTLLMTQAVQLLYQLEAMHYATYSEMLSRVDTDSAGGGAGSEAQPPCAGGAVEGSRGAQRRDAVDDSPSL